MKLYSYWRSTTSYRVRAALNLKGLRYDTVPIDLMAGEQQSDDYLALNSGGGVPTLILADGSALTQSLAIIDYIDAMWPDPRLIPADPLARAQVLAVAHSVAMDVHPVNNLRVLGQLAERFDATPQQKTDWMCHWLAQGFAAIEPRLSNDTPFAFGQSPDLADLCITAQVYNAERWGLDMSPYPKITRVLNACLNTLAILDAHPDNQPDAKGVA